MFTELKERILWYDGKITLSEEQLIKRLLDGKPIGACYIDEIKKSIKKFNAISDFPMDVKYNNAEIIPSWNIPVEYQNINIFELCMEKLSCGTYDESYLSNARSRIEAECKLIDQNGMQGLIKAVIYLLDCFEKANLVWGVGRGSSCASYVLYILGLHCVDCIIYDIDAKEFFR